MLSEQTSDPPLETLEPVASAAEVVAAIEDAKGVYVEESINRYVVALLRQTRSDTRLHLGASPRAGIALLRVAKAKATVELPTGTLASLTEVSVRTSLVGTMTSPDFSTGLRRRTKSPSSTSSSRCGTTTRRMRKR